MTRSKVSVLIPVYNTEQYIGQAIQSIIDQTFQEWELIVLDDCSSDGTIKICALYAAKDHRIKLFKNERNLGMMANWNKGLEYCSNPYFAKLDADDWWEKNMLQDCFDILETQASVGMVFTKHHLIDESGKIISHEYDLPYFANERSFSGLDLVLKGVNGMLADNVMKQGIGLVRKSIFQESGPFMLHDAGDTEMWFRIASKYQIYGVNKFYHYHRVWPRSFTRTKVLERGKEETNLFEIRNQILKYYFNIGLLEQPFYMKQLNANQFNYNKFLVYKYRVERKYWKMIRTFVSNLILSPIELMQFYLQRLHARE